MRDYTLESHVEQDSACTFCDHAGAIAVSNGSYAVVLCMRHFGELPPLEEQQ